MEGWAKHKTETASLTKKLHISSIALHGELQHTLVPHTKT